MTGAIRAWVSFALGRRFRLPIWLPVGRVVNDQSAIGATRCGRNGSYSRQGRCTIVVIVSVVVCLLFLLLLLILLAILIIG